MSESRKIYIVTQGSYSDYSIIAVFSTQELADEYVRPLQTGYDRPHVEEHDLDVPYESAPPGHSQYFGTIVLETGEVKSVGKMNFQSLDKPMVYDEINWEDNPRRYEKTGNKELRIKFFARDDEHAAKILTEKRQEHLRKEV